jgi:hypothetical protein
MATYYELCTRDEYRTSIRAGTLGEMLGYLDAGVQLDLYKVGRRRKGRPRPKRRMAATKSEDGTWQVEEAFLNSTID